VFRQFQYVELDPLRHLDLLKKYNSYREPSKQTSKRRAKSKAFGDYTEDDDDDDD
jgi:hypothetical protein